VASVGVAPSLGGVESVPPLPSTGCAASTGGRVVESLPASSPPGLVFESSPPQPDSASIVDAKQTATHVVKERMAFLPEQRCVRDTP
jgi:hypothetical protein